MITQNFDFFGYLAEVIRPIIKEEVRSALAEIKKPPPVPDRMNLNQFCELTGMARPTAYSKTSRKEIPFHKTASGRLWFSRKETLVWMERGE